MVPGPTFLEVLVLGNAEESLAMGDQLSRDIKAQLCHLKTAPTELFIHVLASIFIFTLFYVGVVLPLWGI